MSNFSATDRIKHSIKGLSYSLFEYSLSAVLHRIVINTPPAATITAQVCIPLRRVELDSYKLAISDKFQEYLDK